MKISKPNIKENTLVVGFPSNGLIGIFSISYLIYSLKMRQIGEIEIPDLPATIFVEEGEILTPIRIYNKGHIFIIISDIPFNEFQAEKFALAINDFCKKNVIKKVMIVSGMDTINQKKETPKIFGLATHPVLEKLLYSNKIPKFLDGSIFGTDAAIISVFRKTKIPVLMLYAECHPFFPDPQASIKAIITLARILDIKIDTKDIQKKVERLRIQHRNLMEETIKALKHQREQIKPPQIYR